MRCRYTEMFLVCCVTFKLFWSYVKNFLCVHVYLCVLISLKSYPIFIRDLWHVQIKNDLQVRKNMCFPFRIMNECPPLNGQPPLLGSNRKCQRKCTAYILRGWGKGAFLVMCWGTRVGIIFVNLLVWSLFAALKHSDTNHHIQRRHQRKTYYALLPPSKTKLNSVAFSPQANYTERPPLDGEVSANFCG
jgi:hypothetical protein